MTLNWHECRRWLIDAWPGFVFVFVLAGSLSLPYLLLGDAASAVLIGSLILQFCGLLMAAYGLKERGILFDRVPPWIAIPTWAGSFKHVFSKPKVASEEVVEALGATDFSGVGLVAPAGQKTLLQRVDELEKRVEQLREADLELRKDITAEIHEVRDLLTTEIGHLRTELLKAQAKLHRSSVGNYPWEWVGLFWLVFGVFFRILAEF